MKRKNTLWSLVLALVMVLGVFAPLGALASDAKPTEDKTETVILHKILVDKEEVKARKVTLTDGTGEDAKSVSKVIIKKKEENKDVFYQADGTKITGTEKVSGTNLTWKQFTDAFDTGKEVFPSPKGGEYGINDEKYTGNEIKNIQAYFGSKAKDMKDVYFAWQKMDNGVWKYIDKKGNFLGIQDPTQAGFATQTDILGGKTGADGSITFDTKDLAAGTYQIQEIKSLSTYKGDKEEILAEQTAVPVDITLPVKNEDGVMKTVHVYPKNTEDGPKVTKKVRKIEKETVVTENGVKTVKNEYVDADQATFDIGQEHTWAIEATIPTGFKDYKVFALSDTLKKALTYKANQKVSVKVGNVELESADYKVTEPTPTQENGGTLTVELTQAGIDKLAASYEGQTLRVEFVTTINENAVMSQDITNKVKLEYGHDKNNKHEKESNEPKVYTGGKRFKKIDSGENNKVLKGAQFVVMRTVGEGKDAINQCLVETGTKPNKKYSWKTVDSVKAADLVKDTDLKVIESDDKGLFEITGLKYERPAGTKYKLVEIKAPEGYALPDKNITEFTVNDTSYYKDAKQVTLEAADPENIDNKKITIPQTGGMGTMIFMVAGLALMGGAFVAMRRRSAEQA